MKLILALKMKNNFEPMGSRIKVKKFKDSEFAPNKKKDKKKQKKLKREDEDSY